MAVVLEMAKLDKDTFISFEHVTSYVTTSAFIWLDQSNKFNLTWTINREWLVCSSINGVNIDYCTMKVCDLAQWNIINRPLPMTKPPAQTVHYLKHTVCLKTWWNKVLVQIYLILTINVDSWQNVSTSEQKHNQRMKRWACGLQCFSGSLNNLKWLFVNHYDLDKFIIYNPILHYVQEW